MKMKIKKEIIEKVWCGCEYLIESGLSRIKSHSENGFFTISACRHEYSDEENLSHTDQLINDIRSYGLGYILLMGGYIEHDADGNEVPVEEISLFVPYKDNVSIDEFSDIADTLAKKYDQDGYILCSPEDKTIYSYTKKNPKSDTYDEKDNLGKFSFDNMSMYYSRLKKGGSQSQIKYVFEGTRYPSNIMHRYGLSRLGEIVD